MPTIILHTFIESDVESCFDLSRSPTFHVASTSDTQERVVQGDPSRLMELGDTIIWEAIHFFVRQRLQVKITEFDRPHQFTDEMLHGAFKSMKHTHYFAKVRGGTKMTDVFEFTSPLGILGRLVDRLVLKRYMTVFLKRRNRSLKRELER